MVKVSNEHYCFCEECDSVLIYGENDVKEVMFGQKIIECPNCGNCVFV